LSAANLAAERGQTAIEELNRLIVEAEGREAAAAIDARKDEAHRRMLRLTQRNIGPPWRALRDQARLRSCRFFRRLRTD
jgi:hypothetical protein